MPQTLHELSVGSLLIELGFAGIALAVGLLSRRGVAARLGLVRGRASAVDVARVCVGTLALSVALEATIELAGWLEDTPLERLYALLAGARGADLALALLAIGLAPGLAEELLCRGAVQRGLEARLGGAAVLVGALCFGALHADWVHGGFAVVLGLYLGAASLTLGSVWPAIFAHASNNLLAVYLAAVWPTTPTPGVLGIALCTSVAVACLPRPRPRARNATSGLQVEPGPDDV